MELSVPAEMNANTLISAMCVADDSNRNTKQHTLNKEKEKEIENEKIIERKIERHQSIESQDNEKIEEPNKCDDANKNEKEMKENERNERNENENMNDRQVIQSDIACHLINTLNLVITHKVAAFRALLSIIIVLSIILKDFSLFILLNLVLLGTVYRTIIGSLIKIKTRCGIVFLIIAFVFTGLILHIAVALTFFGNLTIILVPSKNYLSLTPLEILPINYDGETQYINLSGFENTRHCHSAQAVGILAGDHIPYRRPCSIVSASGHHGGTSNNYELHVQGNRNTVFMQSYSFSQKIANFLYYLFHF